MKKIQDFIRKKKLSAKAGARRALDEKTIVRVFLEVAKGEIKNLNDADIRETKFKEKTLYIKTTHPVISSELCMRREKILKETNRLAGESTIEKIVV